MIILTEEQREALIKELCYRFYYGVKVEFEDNSNIFLKTKLRGEIINLPPYKSKKLEDLNKVSVLGENGKIYQLDLESIRILLRPLSSFTEEEQAEYGETFEMTKMKLPHTHW